MRDIKFRIWDNKSKSMIKSGIIDKWFDDKSFGLTHILLGIDGTIVGYSDDDGGSPRLCSHRIKLDDCRLILMQFSGFKDINGKEIYEDDLIRTIWGIRRVVFAEDIGCWVLDNDIGAKCIYTHIRGEEIEVIGNIYDNPELFK